TNLIVQTFKFSRVLRPDVFSTDKGGEAGDGLGLCPAKVCYAVRGARTEIKDVGEITLFAVDPGDAQHSVKDKAGGADERFAFFLFLNSPCFAEDHYVSHSSPRSSSIALNSSIYTIMSSTLEPRPSSRLR